MSRRSRRSAAPRLVPTGFVLVRTARLPFETALPPVRPANELAELVRASRAPIVIRAIAHASPDLERALERWREDPRDRRTTHATMRTLLRLATRPTPFGESAAMSLGSVGERTRLRLAATPERRVRLSPALLQEAVDRAAREGRDAARLTLNPSAHLAAERVHLSGPADWSAVSVVEPSWLVIELMRNGPRAGSMAEWRAWLRGLGLAPGVARAAIRQLVATEILLPEPIRLTDGDQEERVATLLHGTAIGRTLRGVGRSLEGALARGAGLSQVRTRARAISDGVRPIDVDLIRRGHPTLDRELVAEIGRAIEWLHHWSGTPASDPLADFRRAFIERYGDARVPLLEAVDPETGVGLSLRAPEPRAKGFARRGDPRWRLLGRRLDAGPAEEIQLSWSDLGSLDPPARPLPRGLAALGAVIATTGDGERQTGFFLENAHGPSGAELVGRLTAVDRRIATAVRRHLRAESEATADAILAEVVHLPANRLAPILTRARLRQYEIVGLGQSSVATRRQLPLDDLLVSVSAGAERTTVESRRLGRRIEPRLTTAHRAIDDGFRPYRLLAWIQREGVAHRLAWSWGPYHGRAALPRVRLGKVVLARRRWRLTPATLARWDDLDEGALGAAIASWRRHRRVSRWVAARAAGDELILDLERPLTVAAVLSGRDPGPLVLEEMLPDPKRLALTDGVARYVHDVIVPFVDRAPAKRTAGLEPPRPRPTPAATRSTQPAVGRGGYLSIKLYGGPAVADRLLPELETLVRSLDRSDALDNWFFVRYRDPDPHLRLRFRPGDIGARELARRILPVVEDWRARGLGHRIVVDRYRPEHRRWGGATRTAPVERWFRADSEAALMLLSDERAGERAERLALGARGADDLLAGLSFDLSTRLATVDALRRRRPFEASVEAEIKQEAGRLFRSRREPAGSRGACSTLERRQQAARTLGSALGSSGATRRQPAPRPLAGDLTHLWRNRLLPGGER
ncbi:MAG: lantibiotic dehydratase, partial [Gemmatimonadales bacterium]